MGDISPWPQQDYRIGSPGKQKHVRQWGGPQSAAVKHFLGRLLADTGLPDDRKRTLSVALMKDIWHALRSRVVEPAIFVPGSVNGACRLNPLWVRIKPAKPGEVWECGTCATLTTHNIRDICPRNGCPGTLQGIESSRLHENHYRILYEVADLPPKLSAEEHTAQIDSDKARQRQDRFKSGNIHLLSSSTTFEVGVDLGDLEAVFLRNVPPEPFNYTQRVGRAGRRDRAGLALTYCRRNPHDLYHYEDPENRVINGAVRPPRLRMTNEKIVLRHMTATALSAFFRENPERFESTQKFVGENWSNPRAVSDLKAFCKDSAELKHSLLQIVPEKMYDRVGLENDVWIDNISGPESRFVYAEAEVCGDYTEMKTLREQYFKEGRDRDIGRIGKRMKTIAEERTLNFLSRKAVIPKYGFPVDVVELDTRSDDGDPASVALQRDLSQTIAEYAPGGKVVANKREWESCGVKSVAGKEWPVRYYRYDDARNFDQWTEGQPSGPPAARKYLIPEFGFVTPLFKKPSEPRGRARRLYTTRPFFLGFGEDARPKTKTVLGVRLTETAPGTLIILCEGRNRKGFFICRSCGAHTARRQAKHKSPSGSDCRGTLEQFSLGHELVTDVVRLQFPQLYGEWDAYSVAYAVLLGAAETLNVPDTDLNVTIRGGDNPGESAIVLYDNVPGGAGLVAQLEEKRTFAQVVHSARERVQGNCGCDSSPDFSYSSDFRVSMSR